MRPSPFIIELAAEIAGLLEVAGPLSKEALVERTGASAPSIQRALDWLRQAVGAPVSCDGVPGQTWFWSIEPGWSFPVGKIGQAELRRAWAERERLRQMLECEDVVAEVERLILADLVE